MENNSLSFIHCADLHLDSPFKGLGHVPNSAFEQIRDSTFASLRALTELAIEKQVDFVLIVGDVFDDNKQSLKARMQFRKALENLEKHDIAVFLSYGNHDSTSGNDFVDQFPKNVHVFTDQKVSCIPFIKNGKTAAHIYGFSYRERAVHENKTEEFTAAGDAPFHIGMLHGSIHTNSDHDVYAPFKISDLTGKNFDYWALGHIHARELLKQQPPIVYPGNIQGRSKKETGPKGCYYVELDKENADLQFFPLQQIRFENIELDVSACKDAQDLEPVIERSLSQCRQTFGRSILHVTFTSDRPMHVEWQQAGYFEDAVDYVNDSNRFGDKWTLIQGYDLYVTKSWSKEELQKGNHFAGELVRLFNDTDNIQQYLQPLLRHRQARKFSEPFTEQEEEQIKDEARDLLLTQLLKK
ncbi:metallophosphoesterase family protein [Sediminibacillus albus]|uniref:DNA repair exonuclease SbcCD nuclease subunit n=1 Tax=Sediminibacillus albus TaxID=407036 RepID=A0A1G8XFF3_9BACI|nr:DNA repair exonuclease [Sediminibacillus albus]SDJ89044.1 DNA repair exonuclease SbcCD nuclease subunit [Sediminibacillus albus]